MNTSAAEAEEGSKRVVIMHPGGKFELVEVKLSELTKGWREHAALDGIPGRKLGVIVEDRGELNTEVTRMVHFLRFEFGLSGAGEGARGRGVLYDDDGDITREDWNFLHRWMAIKRRRGDRENAALHDAQTQCRFQGFPGYV